MCCVGHPRLWLILFFPGCNIVLWGAILMLHATASSFRAFFALRFFLGQFTVSAIALFDSQVLTRA